MLKTPTKHPVERKLEEAVGKVNLLLNKLIKFYTDVPKRTDARMAHLIEFSFAASLLFFVLGLALFIVWRR